MMYTYFVSYAVFANGQSCFGNIQVDTPIRISKNNSVQSLQRLKNQIEEAINLENVIILNFILLEEE